MVAFDEAVPHPGHHAATKPGEYQRRHVPRGAAETLAVLAVAFGVIVIQFVMLTAYAWSATSTAPRNVPVAVAGPAREVALVTGELETAKPGAFKLFPASTAAQMDGLTTRPANVTDIVPTAAADQTGAAFSFTLLPLMIGSLIAGVVFTLRVRDPVRRSAGVAVFGIGGGLVSAAVAHTWLGVVPGNYPAIACAMGLTSLAAAGGVSGLAHFTARFGKRQVGLGLGGVIIMLLGNPFSGMSSAPEMLPGIWGFIGQCLPTGAAATLLRSVAYFNGTHSAGPWTVLGIWAGAGLLLTLTAHRSVGGRSAADPSFQDPPPVVLPS